MVCRGKKAKRGGKAQGDVALPNIRFYSQVVLLEDVMQWWNMENKLCWELEQSECEVPITERILTVKDRANMDMTNPIVKTLCKFWRQV